MRLKHTGQMPFTLSRPVSGAKAAMSIKRAVMPDGQVVYTRTDPDGTTVSTVVRTKKRRVPA